MEKDVNGVMVERRRVKVTGGDVLYDPKVMLPVLLTLAVLIATTSISGYQLLVVLVSHESPSGWELRPEPSGCTAVQHASVVLQPWQVLPRHGSCAAA